VFNILIAIMTALSALMAVAASAWLLNGVREGLIAEYMDEQVEYAELIMGELFTVLSFFVYNRSRAKVHIISFRLVLVHYAVNIYMRTHQLGSLSHTPQPTDEATFEGILGLARANRVWIAFMLLRAVVCHIFFGLNSTIGGAHGKRLFDLFLNTYLRIFEDIYAIQ